MIREFERLSDAEVELMLRAPLLACILIAGADGTIDRKEIKEAISFARKRARSHSILEDYFKELSQDFEDKLKVLIQAYPYEPSRRNPLIISELAGISDLWIKLGSDFSIHFYSMLKSLAAKVASSSGGVLGIRSVGAEEARLVGLPMIQEPRP
jgi:hypothetical protein